MNDQLHADDNGSPADARPRRGRPPGGTITSSEMHAIARNCSAGANCNLHGGDATCLDCQLAPGDRLGLVAPEPAKFTVGQRVLAWDRERGDFVPATIIEIKPSEITVEYLDGMRCAVPYSQVRPELTSAEADEGIRSQRVLIADVLDTVKAWWQAAPNTREEKRQRDKLIEYLQSVATVITED